MSDTDLLERYSPYLQYDSLESYRADSAAVLPEQFFDDGAAWSYTNSLKRKGGTMLATARPKQGQARLGLAFLGRTRYENGVEVRRTDYLDAAGRRYVEDARRMHADPRHADRTYGHVVREATGAIWLQYWFFYYYNDKNYFGFGVHEGDWEMIQIRLGPDGTPTAATFAQHDTAEPFAWGDLELRRSPSGPVPVVYVGRGSHASFSRRGNHWPLFPLPPDYADGKGPRVRPKLEVISDADRAWARWPGKWGSSDSSPRGPADKQQWSDPGGFHREVGGAATRGRSVRARARPTPDLPTPPAPKLTVSRVDDRALVGYAFPKTPRAGSPQPARIVVSLDSPDDDLPPASHAYTVRARSGAVAHPLRLDDRSYVVRAVTYSEDGAASSIASTRLAKPR